MTPKQEAFVEEYCVDRNATQAAIRAGYSEKTAKSIGQENLTKPDIAEAIAKRTEEHNEKCEITRESLVQRLNQLVEDAAEAKQFGPAMKGIMDLAKLAGLDGGNPAGENDIPLADRLKAYEREDAIEQAPNVERLR